MRTAEAPDGRSRRKRTGGGQIKLEEMRRRKDMTSSRWLRVKTEARGPVGPQRKGHRRTLESIRKVEAL